MRLPMMLCAKCYNVFNGISAVTGEENDMMGF